MSNWRPQKPQNNYNCFNPPNGPSAPLTGQPLFQPLIGGQPLYINTGSFTNVIIPPSFVPHNPQGGTSNPRFTSLIFPNNPITVNNNNKPNWQNSSRPQLFPQRPQFPNGPRGVCNNINNIRGPGIINANNTSPLGIRHNNKTSLHGIRNKDNNSHPKKIQSNKPNKPIKQKIRFNIKRSTAADPPIISKNTNCIFKSPETNTESVDSETSEQNVKCEDIRSSNTAQKVTTTTVNNSVPKVTTTFSTTTTNSPIQRINSNNDQIRGIDTVPVIVNNFNNNYHNNRVQGIPSQSNGYKRRRLSYSPAYNTNNRQTARQRILSPVTYCTTDERRKSGSPKSASPKSCLFGKSSSPKGNNINVPQKSSASSVNAAVTGLFTQVAGSSASVTSSGASTTCLSASFTVSSVSVSNWGAAVPGSSVLVTGSISPLTGSGSLVTTAPSSSSLQISQTATVSSDTRKRGFIKTFSSPNTTETNSCISDLSTRVESNVKVLSYNTEPNKHHKEEKQQEKSLLNARSEAKQKIRISLLPRPFPQIPDCDWNEILLETDKYSTVDDKRSKDLDDYSKKETDNIDSDSPTVKKAKTVENIIPKGIEKTDTDSSISKLGSNHSTETGNKQSGVKKSVSVSSDCFVEEFKDLGAEIYNKEKEILTNKDKGDVELVGKNQNTEESFREQELKDTYDRSTEKLSFCNSPIELNSSNSIINETDYSVIDIEIDTDSAEDPIIDEEMDIPENKFVLSQSAKQDMLARLQKSPLVQNIISKAGTSKAKVEGVSKPNAAEEIVSHGDSSIIQASNDVKTEDDNSKIEVVDSSTKAVMKYEIEIGENNEVDTKSNSDLCSAKYRSDIDETKTCDQVKKMLFKSDEKCSISTDFKDSSILKSSDVDEIDEPMIVESSTPLVNSERMIKENVPIEKIAESSCENITIGLSNTNSLQTVNELIGLLTVGDLKQKIAKSTEQSRKDKGHKLTKKSEVSRADNNEKETHGGPKIKTSNKSDQETESKQKRPSAKDSSTVYPQSPSMDYTSTDIKEEEMKSDGGHDDSDDIEAPDLFSQDSFYKCSPVNLSDSDSDDDKDLQDIPSMLNFDELDKESQKPVPNTPAKLGNISQLNDTLESSQNMTSQEMEITEPVSTAQPSIDLDALLELRIKQDANERELDEMDKQLQDDIGKGGVLKYVPQEECHSLQLEHKIKIEAYNLEERHTSDHPPGEALTDPSCFGQLFTSPGTLTLESCGFEPGSSHLDRSLDTLSPDLQLEFLLSDSILLLPRLKTPNAVMQWILYTISIHSNSVVTSCGYQLLYQVLIRNIFPSCSPSLLDLIRILVNYGFSLSSLCPPLSPQQFTMEELRFTAEPPRKENNNSRDESSPPKQHANEVMNMHSNQDNESKTNSTGENSTINCKDNCSGYHGNINLKNCQSNTEQDNGGNSNKLNSNFDIKEFENANGNGKINSLNNSNSDGCFHLQQPPKVNANSSSLSSSHHSSSSSSLPLASHQSSLPVENFQKVLHLYTYGIRQQGQSEDSCYTLEDLSVMCLVLCKVAVDEANVIGVLKFDIQACLSSVLYAVPKDQWKQWAGHQCFLLCNLSSHHHNLVHMIQHLPWPERGLYIQRRVSYLCLLNLINNQPVTENEVDLETFTVASVHRVLRQMSPPTDFYLFSSIISLIDLSVGNEPLPSIEKAELRQLSEYLHQSMTKIRESINSMERSMVKGQIARLLSKWTFMQPAATIQQTLYHWTRPADEQLSAECPAHEYIEYNMSDDDIPLQITA